MAKKLYGKDYVAEVVAPKAQDDSERSEQIKAAIRAKVPAKGVLEDRRAVPQIVKELCASGTPCTNDQVQAVFEELQSEFPAPTEIEPLEK